ncbi:MAG TPA: hypothetical protein ENK37_02465 [Oceanithermus profundus]|uniref:DsrE family protein n=1 Tax=Oceanithermus profundus TaxID=187137 RepID=A0A7C4V4W2_9DEIN|nr:hypothetical protein [Oceanithermus profundus]
MELSIVLLADRESHADMGRMVNALETAREALEAGAEVEVVFDDAGTRWVGVLAERDHKHHGLFLELKPHLRACDYCARAFGVLEEVKRAGVERLSEHRGHPSLFARLRRGAHVLTF